MKIKFKKNIILLEQKNIQSKNVNAEIKKLKSIVANGIMYFDEEQRMFIILKTPNGPQSFYRSTGISGTGHEGMWLPSYGVSLDHPDGFGYVYYPKYSSTNKEAPSGSILYNLGNFMGYLESEILKTTQVSNFRDAWEKMGGQIRYISTDLNTDEPEVVWKNMSSLNNWMKMARAPLQSPERTKASTLPGVNIDLEQLRALDTSIVKNLWN